MPDPEKPTVCTLDAGSYRQRIAWISALVGRALPGYRRDGLQLHLTFDASARPEIERLVRQERECCSFFEFSLAVSGKYVTLTIAVPANTANRADELLAAFTPAM